MLTMYCFLETWSLRESFLLKKKEYKKNEVQSWRIVHALKMI